MIGIFVTCVNLIFAILTSSSTGKVFSEPSEILFGYSDTCVPSIFRPTLSEISYQRRSVVVLALPKVFYVLF